MSNCVVDGCENQAKHKGYCIKHYKQMLKHGRLTPEREHRHYTPSSKCEAKGCQNKPSKRGYCGKHYGQLMQFGKIFERTIHDKNEIVIQEDYAEIVLYDLKCQEVARTKIDIEDIELVSQFKWGLGCENYVRAKDKVSGKSISLHRLLLQPPDNADVDHINHDTLDNRRCNLRVCTRSQNNVNAKKRKTNTSGFVGVSWNKQKQKWEAKIWVNKKRIHLGLYNQIEEAARVRRDAEKDYYGDFVFGRQMVRVEVKE